jgi:hypothetical protein
VALAVCVLILGAELMMRPTPQQMVQTISPLPLPPVSGIQPESMQTKSTSELGLGAAEETPAQEEHMSSYQLEQVALRWGADALPKSSSTASAESAEPVDSSLDLPANSLDRARWPRLGNP